MTQQAFNQTKSNKQNIKEIANILREYAKGYSEEELQLIAIQLLEAHSNLKFTEFNSGKETSYSHSSNAIKGTRHSSSSLQDLKNRKKKGNDK